MPRAQPGEAPAGLRFSIIAWGARRRIHARNGGTGLPDDVAPCHPTPLSYADAWGGAPVSGAEAGADNAMEQALDADDVVLPSTDVAQLMRSTGPPSAALPQRARRSSRSRFATETPARACSPRVPRSLLDRLGASTFAELRSCSLSYQRGETTAAAYVSHALRLVDTATLSDVLSYLPKASKRDEARALLQLRQ